MWLFSTLLTILISIYFNAISLNWLQYSFCCNFAKKNDYPKIFFWRKCQWLHSLTLNRQRQHTLKKPRNSMIFMTRYLRTFCPHWTHIFWELQKNCIWTQKSCSLGLIMDPCKCQSNPASTHSTNHCTVYGTTVYCRTLICNSYSVALKTVNKILPLWLVHCRNFKFGKNPTV